MQIDAGMKQTEIVEMIAKSNPKARVLNGFDSAIVGFGRTAGGEMVVVYDWSRILSLLVRGGMTAEEADQFVEFNLETACAGPDAPVIARLCIP
jgi:hypothetical protein